MSTDAVPSRAGVLAVLESFYAAETDYIATGGPGRADFAVLAACLTPDVVMHQAAGLPYGGEWRGAGCGLERPGECSTPS